MESAGNGVNIVILDACRDNPFRSFVRSSSRGLVAIRESATGTLIAFATAPGKVASDGTGRNGLFTSYLLKYIKTPNLDVERMLGQVRADVATTTKNYQVPWSSSSLIGEFSFNPTVETTTPIVTNSPSPKPNLSHSPIQSQSLSSPKPSPTQITEVPTIKPSPYPIPPSPYPIPIASPTTSPTPGTDTEKLEDLAKKIRDYYSQGDFQKAMELLEQLRTIQRSNIRSTTQSPRPEPNLTPPVETSIRPSVNESVPHSGTVLPESAQSSTLSVNYDKLHKFLVARNWKAANEETTRIIDFLPREGERYDITCKDLGFINQLWLNASNGHFGFSVQKEIYQGLDKKTINDAMVPLEDNPLAIDFAERVGWKEKGSWTFRTTFEINAARGHLPQLEDLGKLAEFFGESASHVFIMVKLERYFKILTRVQTCNL